MLSETGDVKNSYKTISSKRYGSRFWLLKKTTKLMLLIIQKYNDYATEDDAYSHIQNDKFNKMIIKN